MAFRKSLRAGAIILSITDLATKVIVAKSETYLTATELLQPSERLEKITTLVKGMLKAPTKRQNIPDNGLSPENPRVKLKTMGVDWSVNSFAEALYSGDLDVVELFLNGGMSPLVRFNKSSVLFNGIKEGALKPLAVLDLLKEYQFDFKQDLFDESIMKDISNSGLLPYSYNQGSYFTPPKGYNWSNGTFEGPLLLWLYQVHSYLGLSESDLGIFLKVKKLTGVSEQVYHFINQHQPTVSSESKLKALFEEDLLKFNTSRGKGDLINKNNISKYRKYWPRYLHISSPLKAANGDVLIDKEDGLIVLGVKNDKLVVRKTYDALKRQTLFMFKEEIDLKYYEVETDNTHIIYSTYYNYINNIEIPRVKDELRHKVYRLDKKDIRFDDNKLYFVLTARDTCPLSNSAIKSIKQFLEKNKDKLIPILMPGGPNKEDMHSFAKRHKLKDWMIISYEQLDNLQFLNSIISSQNPQTLLPHLSIVDSYGVIKFQKFSFKELTLTDWKSS